MKNKIFWICIIFWTLITFLRMLMHQPWLDESNVWMIAKNMEFGSILSSLKYEGHFLIWFFTIMPFAKFNLGYPYSMLFINWLFCFAAILILWLYSPINHWAKACISFSFPFLACYSVVARCYSIGIFFIFILLAMYKDKLKHPIIYAFLILLCANTSLMAAIGAFALGLILLFELYKQKQNKDLWTCIGVFLFCLILLIIQVSGVDKSHIPTGQIPILTLDWTLKAFIFNKIINLILLILFAVGFGVILYRDKKSFFFIAINYILLFSFFQFVYAGNFWHHYFFYIYLIGSCWIFMLNENISCAWKKYITVLLCILSVLFVIENRIDISVYHSNSRILAEFIKEHPNSKSIFLSKVFLATLPYLEKENKKYDISMYNSENANYDITLNFEEIKKLYKSNKENYLYINSCAPIPNLTDGKKELIFTLDKNIKNIYCVYKIEFVGKK